MRVRHRFKPKWIEGNWVSYSEPIHHNEVGTAVVNLDTLVTWDLAGVEIFRVEDPDYMRRLKGES